MNSLNFLTKKQGLSHLKSFKSWICFGTHTYAHTHTHTHISAQIINGLRERKTDNSYIYIYIYQPLRSGRI